MRLKRIFVFLVIFSMAATLSSYAQKQKKVDPVNWRKLTPFLIDIEGWESEGDAEGSTISMGEFKMSQAERSYSAGDKSLEIEIVDGAYVPMFYASFTTLAAFEVDTSEEYIKKVTIKGFPAVEKYEYDDKDAELMIVVADRFLVHLQGEDFKNAAELKKIAKLLHLKKLAAIAK